MPPRREGRSLADAYANAGKRVVEVDPAEDQADLERLVCTADVIVDGRALAGGWARALDLRTLRRSDTIWLELTPFGGTGPRAHWRGNDLVCTARGGMTFVNGPADEEPVTPFGLAAYAATGLVGAVSILTALRTVEQTGRGAHLDLSVQAAAAAALEHVTGLFRQSGVVQRRQGTLHWSRTFRVGAAADGMVLLTHLGDWTTLAEWAASEHAPARVLTDERWNDVALRRDQAVQIFDVLDGWLRDRSAGEVCDGAQLRRLPLAHVRRPERLADDEQLLARRFAPSVGVGGEALRIPRLAGWRAAEPLRPRADIPLDDAVESWRGRETSERTPSVRISSRPLGGVVVLDFTWVVAGPVATRILADQGARVIKVEHRDAPDFGDRRGGLSGNLNRGKESVVLDLAQEAGRRLARELAARADVVIDNFSTRVMDAWGLDHASLCRDRPDAIAVRLPGFGLDGPLRDGVSYGPTLQARVGYPYLMKTERGTPSGWGYSWSDMAAGWSGALAVLSALRHRDQTGEGRLVDVSQLENLAALLGPASLELLAGRPVDSPANRSQEAPCEPHGVFRCAAEGADDDRWLALAVDSDDAWATFAKRLVRDGASWAGDAELRTLAGRLRRRDDLHRNLRTWMASRRAEDLEGELQALGIMAGLVASGPDLLRDPQLRDRGYFQNAAAPGEEAREFDGIPYVSDLRPGRIAAPGPLCGEHTDSVLSDMLGLAAEEIRRLREEEVIG